MLILRPANNGGILFTRNKITEALDKINYDSVKVLERSGNWRARLLSSHVYLIAKPQRNKGFQKSYPLFLT